MAATGTGVDLARLDQAAADIRAFITDPEDREFALKQLASIRDYSPDDQSTCTWEMALDNCEQIKGYFPATASAGALENIDGIREEIGRLQKARTSVFVRILTNPVFVVLAGIALVALIVLSLSQSRY